MNRLDALVLQATNDLHTPDEDARMREWLQDVLTLLDRDEEVAA